MRLAWVISLLIFIVQCNAAADNSIDLNPDNEVAHFPSSPGSSINILPIPRQSGSQENDPFVPALEETKNTFVASSYSHPLGNGGPNCM